MKHLSDQSGFIDEIILLLLPFIVIPILIAIAFPWFSGVSPASKDLEEESKAECLEPREKCPGYFERR